MSTTTLLKKTKRKQSAQPKEKRQEKDGIRQLTIEELERLIEPGHLMRNAELSRELIQRNLNRQNAGEYFTESCLSSITITIGNLAEPQS